MARPTASVKAQRKSLEVGEALGRERDAILAHCRERLGEESLLCVRPERLPEVLGILESALLGERDPAPSLRTWARRQDWSHEGSASDSGAVERLPADFRELSRALLEALQARASLDGETRARIKEGLFAAMSEVFRQAVSGRSERVEEEKRMRKALVSMVSHDIRGPLAAIRSGVQLMIRYPERVQAREKLLENVIESIDRADGRIQDFVDASRIMATETLPLQVIECDLAEELSKIRNDLSSIHAERLVLQIPPKLRGYWAAGELRRAVRNLVRNALTYGETGRPVTIEAEEDVEQVRIRVHNEGAVLGPDQREMVFRPFLQASGPSAQLKKGWGFGLLLTRGLIEAHGGKLELESGTEKGGVTFVIDLPRDSRPYQSFLIHVA